MYEYVYDFIVGVVLGGLLALACRTLSELCMKYFSNKGEQ